MSAPLSEEFGKKGHIGFITFKTPVGFSNIETSPEPYDLKESKLEKRAIKKKIIKGSTYLANKCRDRNTLEERHVWCRNTFT
jgi:hypothetical protein